MLCWEFARPWGAFTLPSPGVPAQVRPRFLPPRVSAPPRSSPKHLRPRPGRSAGPTTEDASAPKRRGPFSFPGRTNPDAPATHRRRLQERSAPRTMSQLCEHSAGGDRLSCRKSGFRSLRRFRREGRCSPQAPESPLPIFLRRSFPGPLDTYPPGLGPRPGK